MPIKNITKETLALYYTAQQMLRDLKFEPNSSCKLWYAYDRWELDNSFGSFSVEVRASDSDGVHISMWFREDLVSKLKHNKYRIASITDIWPAIYTAFHDGSDFCKLSGAFLLGKSPDQEGQSRSIRLML